MSTIMLERSGIVKRNLSVEKCWQPNPIERYIPGSRLPLHPKPLRFTKANPKPQRAKSMTIAAGFRCFDGVVLSTDSECTAGQSKFYDKKIFEAKADNAEVYIAGAGDYSYITSAAEEICAAIKGKAASLDQIKAAAQDAVSDIYKQYSTPAFQAGDPAAPTLSLLVAAYVKGDKKAALFKVAETGGPSPVDSGFTSIGTDAAQSLLREQADLFYRDYNSSVYTLRILAPYMIRRVVKFAAYCGGSAQVGCIVDGGISHLHNSASDDPGPDALSDMLFDLPEIMEACLSGRVSTTESIIKTFSERVREVAEKRRRFLGSAHPAEANGWTW